MGRHFKRSGKRNAKRARKAVECLSLLSENSRLKNIDLAKEKEILLKTPSIFFDFVKAYTELGTNY